VINIICFRRIQPSDLSFIAECKEDVKTFKAGRRISGEKAAETAPQLLSSPSPHTAAPPGPPEHRRERKSKFSVKDIFNFRKQSGVGGVTSVDVGRGSPLPEPPSESGVRAAVGKKRRRLPSNIKSDLLSDVKSDCEEKNRSSTGSAASLSMIEKVSESSRLVKPTTTTTLVANNCHGDGDESSPGSLSDGLRTVRGENQQATVRSRRPSSRDKDEEDRNGNSPLVGTGARVAEFGSESAFLFELLVLGWYSEKLFSVPVTGSVAYPGCLKHPDPG